MQTSKLKHLWISIGIKHLIALQSILSAYFRSNVTFLIISRIRIFLISKMSLSAAETSAKCDHIAQECRVFERWFLKAAQKYEYILNIYVYVLYPISRAVFFYINMKATWVYLQQPISHFIVILSVSGCPWRSHRYGGFAASTSEYSQHTQTQHSHRWPATTNFTLLRRICFQVSLL